LEEVAGHAGREVLMEVDSNSLLIVGETHEILGLQAATDQCQLENDERNKKKNGILSISVFSNLAT
jgi:hypothetical protein